MAYKAYGKRVIVERSKTQEKEGSILLPEGSKKRPSSGKVISVGDKLEGKINVGDVIHYAQYSGTELVSDKIVVLHEDDILATE